MFTAVIEWRELFITAIDPRPEIYRLIVAALIYFAHPYIGLAIATQSVTYEIEYFFSFLIDADIRLRRGST